MGLFSKRKKDVLTEMFNLWCQLITTEGTHAYKLNQGVAGLPHDGAQVAENHRKHFMQDDYDGLVRDVIFHLATGEVSDQGIEAVLVVAERAAKKLGPRSYFTYDIGRYATEEAVEWVHNLNYKVAANLIELGRQVRKARHNGQVDEIRVMQAVFENVERSYRDGEYVYAQEALDFAISIGIYNRAETRAFETKLIRILYDRVRDYVLDGCLDVEGELQQARTIGSESGIPTIYSERKIANDLLTSIDADTIDADKKRAFARRLLDENDLPPGVYVAQVTPITQG